MSDDVGLLVDVSVEASVNGITSADAFPLLLSLALPNIGFSPGAGGGMVIRGGANGGTLEENIWVDRLCSSDNY